MAATPKDVQLAVVGGQSLPGPQGGNATTAGRSNPDMTWKGFSALTMLATLVLVIAFTSGLSGQVNELSLKSDVAAVGVQVAGVRTEVDAVGVQVAGVRTEVAKAYPSIPGVKDVGDNGKPNIVLALDVNWPPYATRSTAEADGEGSVSGFAPDLARALEDFCDINIHVTQTAWTDCWAATDVAGVDVLGAGIRQGWFHGCMVYNHEWGARNRYMEFSQPMVTNKGAPLGLLTKLDAAGNPLLKPTDTDLAGKKIIDIDAFAPNTLGLGMSPNTCDGDKNFKNIEWKIIPASTTEHPVQAAVKDMLADHTVYGIWTGSDNAQDVMNLCSTDAAGAAATGLDCAYWTNNFGKANGFAYAQTGITKGLKASYTLSVAKKGAGLAAILDPCFDKLKADKKYFDLCEKWGVTGSCFPNAHFPAAAAPSEPQKETKDIATPGCQTGYCKCDA